MGTHTHLYVVYFVYLFICLWLEALCWAPSLQCLWVILPSVQTVPLKEVCWSEPPVIIEKSQWLNKDKYISFPRRESSAPT